MSVSSRYASGEGPGPITPDGCAVEFYAQLPPGHREADLVATVAQDGATVLELGAGAGRVTQSLTARGFQVVAVDESAEMLARIAGAETVVARIEQLDLGRRFDVVILASHLVNVPDDDAALQLLRTCSRHVSREGTVLVERRPPGWFDTAAEMEVERDGILYRLTDIARRSPHVVHATVSYTAGQRTWTQTFTTRRVSDDDLLRMLHSVGLRLQDYLDHDRTWARAALVDQ
jgi:ubiquinone/menaquinone biosynthesis C-methylase UbiE